MAAQPVPAPELKALHERIGRDVADLRRRMRRWTGEGRNSPDDILKVVVEAFRILRAIRDLVPSVLPTGSGGGSEARGL